VTMPWSTLPNIGKPGMKRGSASTYIAWNCETYPPKKFVNQRFWSFVRIGAKAAAACPTHAVDQKPEE
jgi:hypothetical protein